MERINLEALEATLAKATPGEWKWSTNSKRVQVAAVRHAAQVCAVWNTSAHPASAVAHAIVSAHNTLPALIAELRELRAEVERAREDAARNRWCEEMKADVKFSLVSTRWHVSWVTSGDYHALSHTDRNAAIDAARGVK